VTIEEEGVRIIKNQHSKKKTSRFFIKEKKIKKAMHRKGNKNLKEIILVTTAMSGSIFRLIGNNNFFI
tara:strand:- start:128 stop:331 length:204 start_codon:yes stop_codon:yes gene_type:complete